MWNDAVSVRGLWSGWGTDMQHAETHVYRKNKARACHVLPMSRRAQRRRQSTETLRNGRASTDRLPILNPNSTAYFPDFRQVLSAQCR